MPLSSQELKKLKRVVSILEKIIATSLVLDEIREAHQKDG